MAAYPIRRFLYFVVDQLNRSYYIQDGVVKVSSPPVPLVQDPKGWKEIQVSFGTNFKYWSLNRTFTVPLEFINEAAQICREAVYTGKGYENERFIVVLKLNPDNGHYELEYKGRLDLSKHSDAPRKGITANAIEGGVLSYLNANDGVNYELTLSSINTACKLIYFDGVNLFDKYRYSIVDLDMVKPNDFGHHSVASTFAFPFISNDGDSVGVVRGSQQFMEAVATGAFAFSDITDWAELPTNANYLMYSSNPITLNVTGKMIFTVYPSGSTFTALHIFFVTSLGNTYDILGVFGVAGGVQYLTQTDVIIDLDVLGLSIPLSANEKLFFMVLTQSNSVSSTHVHYKLSDVFFSFISKNPPSTAYGLPIIDVHKQLIQKMSGGRYTGDSVFYSANRNIMWTSTNALQNYAFQVYYGAFQTVDTAGIYTIVIPGALNTLPTDNQIIITGAPQDNGIYTILKVSGVVAGYTTITVLEPVIGGTINGTISTAPALNINYENFYSDVNCLSHKNGAGIGMKIINNVVFIEPKEDLYKADSEIFDIGEISDFDLEYADELLCNTAKFGYKSQDYRQRNGIYEFNTTTLFKLPVDSLKNELNRVLKARADCFGIEFIRQTLFNKPTTDITGDNQPFVIDTVPKNDNANVTASFSATDNSMSFLDYTVPIAIGDVIQISGSGLNDDTRTVQFVDNLIIGNKVIFTGGAAIVNQAAVAITLTFISTNTVKVNRPAYTDLLGVLDNTIYNATISPHELLLNHGRYFASIMDQLPAEMIVFQQADKNSALSKTLAGVTVSERQSEVISSLGDKIFINRYGNFTTVVPISFSRIMEGVGTGYIRGTFYGVPIYFLPIGKMDSKPATNQAQAWKLLLAPNNDLETLKKLSNEGIFTTDAMGNTIFTSVLNSLHFNKYDYTLPAKYHHKDIYDDQFQNRGNSYVSAAEYAQKWQKTEKIPIQCITKGLTTIDVTVYDKDGHVYFTAPMVIVSDPSVPLPYILSNYEIDVTAYPEGFYMVVLSSAGVKLRISEWIDLRNDWPDTLLFEFTNTTSRFQTYFAAYSPKLRVEASLLDWYDDDTHENYTDEQDNNELIDGIPMQKRILETKFIPDWLRRKIVYALLLNRTMIEGIRFSRTPDGKIDKNTVQGVNLASYKIEVSKSINNNGLGTDETGAEDNLVITYTLDAKAFGGGDGNIISIETINE